MDTLDEINHTTFKALQGEPLDFGKLAASLYEAGVANQSLGKVKNTGVDTEIEGLIDELGTPENSRKLAAVNNVASVSLNQTVIFQNFFAAINNLEVSSPPRGMSKLDTGAQSILDRQAATAVFGNHIKNAYGIVKTKIRDVEEPLKLLEACPGYLVSNPPPQPAQANDNG